MEFLIDFFSNYGYWAVFIVLLICGFGIPIPEDITLVSGGVISGLSHTNINVHLMLVVSMFGVLIGDSTMYWLGRIFGEKIIKAPIIRFIATPKRITAVEEKFEKHGWKLLFLARFLPGLRAVVYLISGITRKVSFPFFVGIDFLAAIISVPIWVYLGYFGADNMDWLTEMVKKGQNIILSVIALIIIFVAYRWYKKRKQKSENS